MQNTTKTCLLIFPRSFYSFDKYIKRALTDLGFQVTVINDEYPEGVVGKLLGKLHIPILLPITRHVISKHHLKDNKFDLVLIIKGRGMSVALINMLKTASPKVVGYNFDSFSYNKAPLKWYKHVNKYYTFDYRDAENHSLPIVELFSSISDSSGSKTNDYEVSAILRNHSERLSFTHRVLKILKPRRCFIYIYEKNIFTFILNFINSPILYIKYWKFIFFKPLAYSQYIDALTKSNFTIDFAHPKQSGITIRCFEALCTQTKIITNNPFIRKNHLFNDENSIIYTPNCNTNGFRKKYDQIFNNAVRKYHRTINNFITELIQ